MARALELYTGFGDPGALGKAHSELGDIQLHLGRREDAARMWREAVEILDTLDHAKAEFIRSKVQEVTANSV
ncbi:hypothetical protein [Streptomyces sp. NBC_00103]|uniref:hypothetical protein n=1 Tax=Streptomyces sp. NBC_00103 TaxID=2975653 RepID=UPI0022578BD7|nr:hypothetical protein [Streptomyces sp. NBC_00103]MCX5372135.1 hypothetical protein [Streptomyces sp. NBC_00103]